MAQLEKTLEHNSKIKLNILLIDDNEQISNMLNTFLTLVGHNCTISNDGKLGLELIENQKFDVILLDLAIPEFDGFDIINSLEKRNMIKNNKIILFTASGISQKELDVLVKRGIHSYILKPIELDELLEKITA